MWGVELTEGREREQQSADRPLRLLHVFTRFNTGGSQVRFASLAGALGDHLDHTVLALTGNYEAAGLVPPGVSIRYLDPPPGGPLPRRLAQYRRLLNQVSPDLLLTYNWGTIEFALARMFAPRPHLHHEDGFGPEEATRQFRRRVWLRRLALSDSHLLVPSKGLEAMAQEVWGLRRAQVHYVANGVPPARRSAPALRSPGFRFEAGVTYIAWIGALRPEKNPLRMLQAFAPLDGRVVLLIIGDGPERSDLLQAIDSLGLAGRVHVLGARPDARNLLARCDLLALSSDTEQMPLVVLEAMEAGLPVASVSVGDVPRMVSLENRPYVTPVCPNALGKAVAALAGDAGLRRSVGEANRRRVRAAYRHETMVANYRLLLDELAGSRRR